MYTGSLSSLSGVSDLWPTSSTGAGYTDTQSSAFSGLTSSLTDQVELSGVSLERYEILSILDTATTLCETGAGGRYKTLSEVGQDLQANLADYEGLLGETLNLIGVDTSQPLTLQADGKGHVNVQNEHPDADTVNDLFAGNPTLVSRFMVIAARASILEAAESDPTFRQDYQADPRGAIYEHIDTLKDLMLGFQLQAQDGSITPSYPVEIPGQIA